MKWTWKASTEAWKVKAKGSHRLHIMQIKLSEAVEEFRPDHVVIEGYAYNKGHSAHPIGELGGTVKLALYQWGIEYTLVAPAKLKKFVTGKGNAGKDGVMLEAYKRFEIEEPTQDEVEATCLALMFLAANGIPLKLPKVNLSVLDDIVWGVTG